MVIEQIKYVNMLGTEQVLSTDKPFALQKYQIDYKCSISSVTVTGKFIQLEMSLFPPVLLYKGLMSRLVFLNFC